MAYTCSIDTISEKFKKSLSSESKVKETLLSLLNDGANIEDIIQVVTAPISSKILRNLDSNVRKFIQDEKGVRDVLGSPQVINTPQPATTQTKELAIDNPDAIVQNGKRAKIWLSEAWGTASLAQNKFIQSTNREIQSKILGAIKTSGENEDAEIVLNRAIQQYFEYNLMELRDFFEKQGKHDYAQLISDNMPFDGPNPNERINTIIKTISEYFSDYSDSVKMAYSNPRNPNYDKAQAFARFLLIQPLNFDNFISSNVNSIQIRNKGKLVTEINKYGIQLGKGRQNMTWQDEDAVYSLAKMVDDFVQREVESWPLYRKVGRAWVRQIDEYCETTKVVGVLTKVLKIADLPNSKFQPIINNRTTEAKIKKLKDTFRVAFGINLETGEEVIDNIFEKYIEGKTIPQIIRNINQDPHHLLPIIMYLLTEQENDSKKSIIETGIFREKKSIINLNDNEINTIYSIWQNMFNPMNNNSLYNQVPQNKDFDIYQMVNQVLMTHDKKELYGIVNDMGTVEKKNYSLGRANQRLNQLQSKINGFYSPLLNKSINNVTIENDFESENPSTTIKYKVPFKNDFYIIKIVKGGKASITDKYGNKVEGTIAVQKALKDLKGFFKDVIKVNFTDENLFDIYINKLGGGQATAFENLIDISANLIYAHEVSKYLKGESTSDFKNRLKDFYQGSKIKLVKGVTYNQVDAFSGRIFPMISEVSLANDVNEGIIGDIVVKGGAGEQINSVILRTLTTQYSQFVEEKSQDENSAIKHFSIKDAFKRATFLRDYVDKTGEVKSSTTMNVEEFFLNSFIYDFYGDSLAIHLGVLSDKPNIPKIELYVDTPILVEDGVVKKLKDCTAEDLKKVAVRELGQYYLKMKQEIDRNLRILSQYSPRGIKYNINTDYFETRGYSKSELEEDIHDAIYEAQQAGEDIEINELLYFSWDKNGDLHTKPSLIAELAKHDIYVVNNFGLKTETSSEFFNRKEHELVVNLLQDLKHGISFIDSQSQKIIDSSAVKAMRKANSGWKTGSNIIIGKIIYGEKSRSLITKRSLTDWKVYKDFMTFAQEVAGNEFDLSRLDINNNFDFQYFFNLLNSNYDRIQEYSKLQSIKERLESAIREKLSSPRTKIDKKLLTEQYRQWRLDNIEETEAELNQAVINYETESDENAWIRRNKAFQTRGIKDIISIEEVENYVKKYKLKGFDSTIEIESTAFSLQINPEISRYNTLQYLYSEEGLNSTVGSHINHKVGYTTNLTLMGAMETGQQAKRNVSESGAKNQYTRGEINGNSKEMIIAVVRDVKGGISTVNGIEDASATKVMDGSTIGNFVTRKEELHSLGSQKAGIENSKPLANDLNSKTGTGTIIKTAVFVLTNGRIRSSERNIITHKHMNSIPWDPSFNGDFLHDFDGKEIKYYPVIVYKPSTETYVLRNNFVINEDGTTSFEELDLGNSEVSSEILKVKVKRDLTLGALIKAGEDITPYINTIAAIVKPKNIGNKITNTITTTRPIRTNYELWDLFGGAYSASINDFNELTYGDDNTSLENLTIACHSCGTRINKDVTRPTEYDVDLPLKRAKIDWIVTEGAIKQGAANVNSTKMFDDINYKVTTQKISTADIGMQLNPEHLVDKSHITLMTQVVNALGLKGFSADAANRVYQALATLTDTSLDELFKGIEIRRNTGDNTQFKDAVASLLLKSIIGTSETDGDLLSSIVVQLNKQDRNGHDYDVIKHRLPISDPAILNKLISNFSSLMTKAGVRIQFPGSMNVLVPSDGIYRIHGGKLRKFASTQRYKDSQASKIIRDAFKTKDYAIVWAHPGIGKSYSVEQGQFNDKIIDWDVEFNRIRDEWIAEHSNTKIGTQKFRNARNEYHINPESYPDYIDFVSQEWNKVKTKAIKENKILVASPHLLLRLFPQDFDAVLNISDEVFIKRNTEREANTEENSRLWKQGINNTLNNYQGNIITTDQYLEEILNDIFNNGNLIENNEAEAELQRLQELQAQQQPLEGLHAITIGGSYFITLNTEEQIEPWDDLSAKVLAGESIKIDDLSTYYKVRDLLKGQDYSITEDVISGRELAPYNCTFNTDKGMYMLWDLDSIKHIHMAQNDSAKMMEIYMSYTDEQIAREFHINPTSLDRTIKLNEEGFNESYKKFVDQFKKLINRRKQIELNSIGSGNENGVFIDGQRVIVDKSTLSVSPYELIAPKNYETDFGLRVGDDVSEISSDNLFFLKRLLKTQYKQDNSGHWVDQTPISSNQYDVILKTVSGKNYPIVFKNPNSKIPAGLNPITEQDFYINLDWDGSKVYRLDGNGERLYEIPYHKDSTGKTVYDCQILTDEIGNEVIYTDKIDFFVNKLHFNFIDFGKHITQLPFIYDIFKQLGDCKKKSVKKLFNQYIKGLPQYKQIEQLQKEISKGGENTEELNKQLITITSGGEVNNLLSQQINDYFELRDQSLTLLNTELLTGKIDKEYPPMIQQIIDSSIETHTSFIKSLDYIASRTPAQSHQSFMPMKLIAFDESGKNSAYVSRYQLYLQGSDFDVDKASLLGSIIRNGRYVKWSPLMSLKSIQTLRASETLPFPTGKELQVVEKLSSRVYDKMDKPIHLIWHDNNRITFILPTNGMEIHLSKVDGVWRSDLTQEILQNLSSLETYLIERAVTDKIPEGEPFQANFNIEHLGFNNGVKDSSVYDYNRDFEQFIHSFSDIIPLNEENHRFFDDSNVYNIVKLSVLINALNSFKLISNPKQDELITYIQSIVNEHNTYFKESSDAKDAVVNYISSNMFQISSDPVNLVQAMTSVDQQTDYIKGEIANKSPLAEQSKHFDKGNVMSIFRLLRLTLSGKQNTGIEASSLKVMEAINQYQDVILNYGTDKEQKSLIVPISIGGHQIGMICNAYCKNITNIKSKEVYDALQEVNNDEDQAIWLSAFLSLSTDNAKDPTLAKINANPEMIGLYNAGFVLGLPIDMLSKVIMSPVGMAIADVQQGDIFLGYNSTRNISSIIDYIKSGPRLNPEIGTLKILTKAIQAQYGENVEVNIFNLAKALKPGKYWDQSSLLTARHIIELAKSLAYGKENEEIKYHLPTIGSRLRKDITVTKTRISGISKSIQALQETIAQKESENRGHKREDKKLTSLTSYLEELKDRLTNLQELRNIYESTQEIPDIDENDDSKSEVYREYSRYARNLESIEKGEQSGQLRSLLEDLASKEYARQSANFKKTIQDLENWLNTLEMVQLDQGYVDESGQRHNTLKIIQQLNEFANEMALIRPNLTLNQQLPNSKENQLSFIKKFENVINDRLTESSIKESEALSVFEQINESKDIPGLNVNISEFVWDEDYRKAAIAAYDSIKFKVNVLDVLPKVPHYFGYLKACDALYESLKYQSVQYREQDRILEKVIIGDLRVKSSKDIQARLKMASRYVSRQMNNMFLISQNMELSIPKIVDGKVDDSVKVSIKLGTIEGNKAFKEWMDLVVIPKYKQLYGSNEFFTELSEATYHKSDNHNTIINYTTGIDTMTSNPTEIMKYAEVVEGFNSLTSKSENNLPLVDAFFYYDLIAYDRQPGQQALTPIFNKLAALGNTRVISDYTQFVSDLDQGGNYILTLDDSQVDEIKRFIAPIISIYEIDKFDEDYAWVKDPADQQYYLIERTTKPTKGDSSLEMMDDFQEDTLENFDDIGMGPDGDVNYADEDDLEAAYKPIDLETKIYNVVWENGNPKFRIISDAGNLNNPYMDSFTTSEYQSILEGQGVISSKEIRLGDDIITLDDEGKPIISNKVREKLKKITGQEKIDDLIVTKVAVDEYGQSTVIDIDTTKGNLENPCK